MGGEGAVLAQNIITDGCCGKEEKMGVRRWGRGGLVVWRVNSKQ